MNKDLIKNSKDLSDTASKVLEKTNAVETFLQLGKVEIIVASG